MPIVIVDGCEDTSGINTISAVVADHGRTGKCLQIAAGGQQAVWRWNEAVSDTAAIGAAMRIPDLVTSGNTATLRIEGNNQIAQIILRVLADGTMRVVKNPASPVTLAETAPGVFPQDAWVYVELQATHHATAGSFKVALNNTIVLSATGVNTVPTNNAATSYQGAGFGAYSSTFAHLGFYDDLYIARGSDFSFVGDSQVATIYPDGNGAASDWLGSDGNSVDNYALVNEVGSAALTTRVAASLSGKKDLYTLQDILLTLGPIHAVCHAAVVGKSDSGPASIALVNHGAVDTVSPAYAIALTGANPMHFTLPTNPETGLAWTRDEINALQTGVLLP